jgi:chitin disaccharide deacetylase
MLIINADDWGRSQAETDAALACHRAGRITSVSAMVFMADSQRAAKIADSSEVDVGLHLNLSETFTGAAISESIRVQHGRVVRFLRSSKFALLAYNPFLTGAFRFACEVQLEEFRRLYGREPTHIDGHQHMHLCTNVLYSDVIPRGQRVRRSFTFAPGQKSAANRAYRALVDRRLGKCFRLTDHFFCLSQSLAGNRIEHVAAVARSSNVELMTHPMREPEFQFLTGDGFLKIFSSVEIAPYSSL